MKRMVLVHCNCSQKGLTNCSVFWNDHMKKDGRSPENEEKAGARLTH